MNTITFPQGHPAPARPRRGPATQAQREILRLLEDSSTYTINYVVDLETSKTKAS